MTISKVKKIQNSREIRELAFFGFKLATVPSKFRKPQMSFRTGAPSSLSDWLESLLQFYYSRARAGKHQFESVSQFAV